MRPVIPFSFVALAALSAAAPALAQEGPSFDCRFASTSTEVAICASPRLAQLEVWAVEAYDDLARRIGEAEARAVADVQLARRQECGDDAACIEERLIISMGVFMANGVAAREVALAPPVLPDPFQAEPAAPAPATPTPEERLALGPPREVGEPASPPAAAPASPLASAFTGLPAYRRANIQGRLAQAGFGPDGGAEPDGAWGPATEAALAAFLEAAAAEGRPFDARTPEGAALALAFVDSDAFKRSWLGESVPFAAEW